jgi:hypothetical protein
MSWLSSAWDRNRNFLGNAVKNISPLLAFTPLGPLGAGAAGALGRSMQKGANLGSILKSGVSNAAIGAGAHGLYGAARGALSGATAAGGAAPSNFAAGATGAAPAPPMTSLGGMSFAGPHVAQLPAQGTSSTLAKLMSGLSGAGGFAKDNATVLGGIGSGILNARETGQSNALKQQQFEFEQQQYGDELARRKRIAELLGPLYQQMANSRQAMTPNPYLAQPGGV